ncbi:hypothetical protein PMEGAS228_47630 [Priestia megaterium]
MSSDKQKTGEGLRLIHEFTIYNHGLNRRHIDFTELKTLKEHSFGLCLF